MAGQRPSFRLDTKTGAGKAFSQPPKYLCLCFCAVERAAQADRVALDLDRVVRVDVAHKIGELALGVVGHVRRGETVLPFDVQRSGLAALGDLDRCARFRRAGDRGPQAVVHSDGEVDALRVAVLVGHGAAIVEALIGLGDRQGRTGLAGD